MTWQIRAGHRQTNFIHCLLEKHAIFRDLDRFTFGAIISTPHSASTPASSKSIARFSAVCPPTVGKSASGRSRLMMAETDSTVSGSMYVRLAVSGPS